MPIHDLGYRAWKGNVCSQASRWLVITATGVRLAWKSPWLRRMILLAWLPALLMGVLFFMYEQSISHPQMQRMALDFFRNLTGTVGGQIYQGAIGGDLAEARHAIWGWLLYLFFRHPQGVLMALVVGLIAPPLISQDMRTRAFLLYFSRPLSRVEYILGKMAVVWFYLTLITTLPAIALYLTGVLLSPDLSVIADTWDFPLRILVASVLLMAPTTAIALAFSSMTTRSYYASFGWFAVWAFGLVTYYILYGALEHTGRWTETWSLVSLHHTLGRIQTWLFGIGNTNFTDVIPSLILLASVTIFSIAVTYQRISKQVRQ